MPRIYIPIPCFLLLCLKSAFFLLGDLPAVADAQSLHFTSSTLHPFAFSYSPPMFNPSRINAEGNDRLLEALRSPDDFLGLNCSSALELYVNDLAINAFNASYAPLAGKSYVSALLLCWMLLFIFLILCVSSQGRCLLPQAPL